MREIKFRGLNSEGKWVYGDYRYFAEKHYITPHMEKINAVQIVPETRGQYTEKRDKNGREIYGKDIVSMMSWDTANFRNDNNEKKWITTVEFKYGKWYLGYGNYKYTIPEESLYFIHNDIEVIGNQFENPELLK